MKIKQPTLLINRQKVTRNIKRITTKSSDSKTELWPHFKTHQSHEIGRWFKDEGVNHLTVSSVGMANYFAEAGWQNIYIAFPLNINEIGEIAELANHVNLSVLINEEVQLMELTGKVNTPVHIKLEIETGGLRSGILPDEEQKIDTLIQLILTSQHIFSGFYSHFGHTYRATGPSEVLDIYDHSFSHLSRLQERFKTHQPTISIGDTPSASVLPAFNHINSVHAGNYVFYDLTQAQLGVCSEDDIAISLAVPIVSKNIDRLELVVYGGGIHLSKETIYNSEFDRNIYGKIVGINKDGWTKALEGCYVSSVSQEHGILKVTSEVFEQYDIGDSIGILPVHSCMTADCMGGYCTVDGNKIDHYQAKLFHRKN